MPNPYPFSATDDNGIERLGGDITFTDAGNQPGAQANEIVGADSGANVGGVAIAGDASATEGGTVSVVGGDASATANGEGGSIEFFGGAGDAGAGIGGSISLTPGNADTPGAVAINFYDGTALLTKDGPNDVVLTGHTEATAQGAFLEMAGGVINGGQVQLQGGPTTEVGGNGGPVTIGGGTADDGDGGAVTITAGNGDAVTGEGGSVILQPGAGDTSGQVRIRDSNGDTQVIVADGGVVLSSGAGGVGFFGNGGDTKQTVTGALSTVADAPAKAVLTSIIAALVAYGLVTDGTT